MTWRTSKVILWQFSTKPKNMKKCCCCLTLPRGVCLIGGVTFFLTVGLFVVYLVFIEDLRRYVLQDMYEIVPCSRPDVDCLVDSLFEYSLLANLLLVMMWVPNSQRRAYTYGFIREFSNVRFIFEVLTLLSGTKITTSKFKALQKMHALSSNSAYLNFVLNIFKDVTARDGFHRDYIALFGS